MMIDRMPNDRFALFLTVEELIALSNCLNEVCHGIELFEFETRVGASKEKVAAMLDTILVAKG
jgi:hypothetical protein